MTRVLAVDAGRTTCRVAVVGDGGRVEARAEVPARGTLLDPAGVEAVHAAITAATLELGAAIEEVTHLCAGLAGAWSTTWAGQELASRLGAGLGVEHVAVTNDVVTAYAGAHGLAPGVVLVAGTGSIALAVGPDGAVGRADGWGHVLGDAGSGHWLGRAGLRAAVAAHDGRGPATDLRGRAADRHGALDRLPELIAGARDPARTVAAFATDVIDAAAAGDEIATRLVDEAADHLAATIAAAAASAHPGGAPVAVAAVGGMVGAVLRPRLAEALRRRRPAAQLVPPAGDALAGAALIALAAAGPLEALVHRRPGTMTVRADSRGPADA
jgi:N-acetylglucosamine kinase-like BadF-type ATPase